MTLHITVQKLLTKAEQDGKDLYLRFFLCTEIHQWLLTQMLINADNDVLSQYKTQNTTQKCWSRNYQRQLIQSEKETYYLLDSKAKQLVRLDHIDCFQHEMRGKGHFGKRISKQQQNSFRLGTPCRVMYWNRCLIIKSVDNFDELSLNDESANNGMETFKEFKMNTL